MRYEDLRLNPEPVLMEVFRFLLDVESLEGTVVEKRIQDICAQGTESKSVYALKSKSTNLSRCNDHYTDE